VTNYLIIGYYRKKKEETSVEMEVGDQVRLDLASFLLKKLFCRKNNEQLDYHNQCPKLFKKIKVFGNDWTTVFEFLQFHKYANPIAEVILKTSRGLDYKLKHLDLLKSLQTLNKNQSSLWKLSCSLSSLKV